MKLDYKNWEGHAEAGPIAPGCDLPEFTHFIDLARLPAQWWVKVESDGRDIRATDNTNNLLPIDLIEFSKANSTGFLAVKRDQLTVAKSIRLWVGNPDAVAFGVSDEFGQYNAYDSGWAGFWPDAAQTNRCSSEVHLVPTANTTPGDVAGPIGNTGTNFNDTTRSAIVEIAGLPTGIPITLVSAAKMDETETARDSAGLVGISTQTLSLRAEWDDVGDDSSTTAIHRNTSSESIASDDVTDAVPGWHHHAAVFESTTSRSAFIDGGGKQTNTDTLASPTMTHFIVGRGGTATIPGSSVRGSLSLLQLHSVARPDCWIAYQATMMDQSTFWGGGWIEFVQVKQPVVPRAPLVPPSASGSSFLVQGGRSLTNPRTPAQMRAMAGATDSFKTGIFFGEVTTEIPSSAPTVNTVAPSTTGVVRLPDPGTGVFHNPKSASVVNFLEHTSSVGAIVPIALRGGAYYALAAGGGGVSITDEGSEVAAAATINFTGAGVIATDASGGVVDVTIPGGGLAMTAVKTSPYTAASGDLVLADISGGSFTVTLRNSTANGDRVGVKVVGHDTANALTIDGDGTDTIGVRGFNGTTFNLYLTNDYVELVFQAADNKWHCVSQSMNAHGAELTSDDTTPQSLAHNTVTTAALTISETDNAGMGSLANDTVTIRRTGKYMILYGTAVSNIVPSGSVLRLFVRLDIDTGGGFQDLRASASFPGTTNTIVYSFATAAVDLNAGDILRLSLQVQTSDSSARDVGLVTVQRSRLAVTELF